MAAAMLLISCDDKKPGLEGENFVLSADRYVVQTFGGDYVTLMATLDGKPVTGDIYFFDDEGNPLDLKDNKFSADKEGKYVIWANYGTFNSDPITIHAISVDYPQLPEDIKPTGTDFKARILLTEFTGVECPNCPGMKSVVHEVLSLPEMKDKAIEVACHNYTENDLSYISTNLPSACSVPWYPFLVCDLYEDYDNYNDQDQLETMLSTLYNNKKDIAAGISASSINVDGLVVASVAVKPAKTASYNIGAFLLEDGIYQEQLANDKMVLKDWMHTHNNVIRFIDTPVNYFAGFHLGEIKAGETVTHEFAWDLDQIWNDAKNEGCKWNPFNEENLHFVVYVTTADDSGEYFIVNNVMDFHIGDSVGFDYK